MATFAQVFPAAILFVAAIAKLEDRDRFLRSLASLPWLNPRSSRLLAVVVPTAELLASLLLLVWPAVGASLALLLLIGFTVVITVELGAGRRFDCGCLGSLFARAVGPFTVARNLLLCGLAGALLALPYRFEFPAALTGAGVALLVLVVEATLSTITRERLL